MRREETSKKHSDRVNHQRKTKKKAEDNSELGIPDRNDHQTEKNKQKNPKKRQQPEIQLQFLNSLARAYRVGKILTCSIFPSILRRNIV